MFFFNIRNMFEIRRTVPLSTYDYVGCHETRDARIRNMTTRTWSSEFEMFPVYFESTSKNEAQQITVAIWIPTE